MHWLKRWDEIVFPASYRPKQKKEKRYGEQSEGQRPHRKILMLTGPPGLGKTTLAHVCAKQAGYEAQEINASDERSRDVVKGRIRDMVGTENVKAVDTKQINGKTHKAGKPVCVIVDEVDGVVGGAGGAGGGEGGFIKALIDLVLLDQKNSTVLGALSQAPSRKKKGDRFRIMRPIILICNDVYHPSLRPLRQSSHAEIIHVRKAALQNVAARMHAIFEREGLEADTDGVRRLCEAAWGVNSRKEGRSTGSGSGEGDMRGIMVVGEWVAGRLRTARAEQRESKLSRKWVEDHLLKDLSYGGGGARSLGRGGPKEIVERVFQEGAGFVKSVAPLAMTRDSQDSTAVKGVAEGHKRNALDRLRELVNTHGETDRIVMDCFSAYPDKPFQDDTYLSKPNEAYEWLHFHDRLSSQLYGSNEWELAAYLSTPVLAFHDLFATPVRAQFSGTTDVVNKDDAEAAQVPFAGPQASWAAHEALKQNEAQLQSLHSLLSLDLHRSFTSHHDMATDLLPHLLQMLNPNINPVVVGGSGKDGSTASVRKASEQALVARSITAMGASGVRFERMQVRPGDEGTPFNSQSTWIYRMEPPLDTMGTFETGGKLLAGNMAAKARYGVRQILQQEWAREEKRKSEAMRQARFNGTGKAANTKLVDTSDTSKERAKSGGLPGGPLRKIKRDFFGRPIVVQESSIDENGEGNHKKDNGGKGSGESGQGSRNWVTFHEGFSNAVRKPINLAELMRGL
ncbi:P-loop containing nucleoside triphosphate hydrolase protein, partial [Polychaeton citri CBS 116435]